MNKADIRLTKKKILKCLTEDFEYGTNKRTGEPLKRRRANQAIFDKQDGHAVWNGTGLQMVMDAVVRGLYFALNDSSAADAWILVTDSLPKGYRAVNVSCIDEEGVEFVAEGYYSTFDFVWVLRDSVTVNKDSGIKVIAWQPLPEPLRAAATEALQQTQEDLLSCPECIGHPAEIVIEVHKMGGGSYWAVISCTVHNIDRDGKGATKEQAQQAAIKAWNEASRNPLQAAGVAGAEAGEVAK